MAVRVGRTILVGGVLALGATFLFNHAGKPITGAEEAQQKATIRIEWQTLDFNYKVPSSQPIVWWQLGDSGQLGGGEAGNTYVMKAGVDSKQWVKNKGLHVLTWISTNPQETPKTASSSLKIFIDGEQKCGPGKDDRGTATGGKNAVCEATS